MKKLLIMLLVVCMPFTALAQEAEVTANAVAESRNVMQITAPFSGVLKPFEWELGDVMEEGVTLFELETQKVYAPADGTVRAVFAQAGELAEDVQAQYGMVLSLEKDNCLVVNATTTGAYNDPDNRHIQTGEIVYFEETNDRDNEGEGRVISVNGSAYVVELIKGDFESEDNVKLYRDDNMSTKSCIGSGKLAYQAELAVAGSGRVVNMAVEEGDYMRKGQLLFETVSPDADSSIESAAIAAPVSGAVEVAVQSGMQVYKGQLLAKVHELDKISVVASVDEMDLDMAKAGSSVTVVFDRYPDEVISGTVAEVGKIGVTKQNAAYYDVTIDIHTMLEILPGMNATVYLGK